MITSVAGKGVGAVHVGWSPACRLHGQAQAWTPAAVARWVVLILSVQLTCSAIGKAGFTRCDSCRIYSAPASSAGIEGENFSGEARQEEWLWPQPVIPSMASRHGCFEVCQQRKQVRAGRDKIGQRIRLPTGVG